MLLDLASSVARHQTVAATALGIGQTPSGPVAWACGESPTLSTLGRDVDYSVQLACFTLNGVRMHDTIAVPTKDGNIEVLTLGQSAPQLVTLPKSSFTLPTGLGARFLVEVPGHGRVIVALRTDWHDTGHEFFPEAELVLVDARTHDILAQARADGVGRSVQDAEDWWVEGAGDTLLAFPLVDGDSLLVDTSSAEVRRVSSVRVRAIASSSGAIVGKTPTAWVHVDATTGERTEVGQVMAPWAVSREARAVAWVDADSRTVHRWQLEDGQVHTDHWSLARRVTALHWVGDDGAALVSVDIEPPGIPSPRFEPDTYLLTMGRDPLMISTPGVRSIQRAGDFLVVHSRLGVAETLTLLDPSTGMTRSLVEGYANMLWAVDSSGVRLAAITGTVQTTIAGTEELFVGAIPARITP